MASLSLRQKCELTVRNGIRYFPLLKNLVSRELKKKYRQSFLGYLWCILNPLMVMVIMTAVFSQMFRSSIENFPVYLFAGRMMYSFVTDSAGSVMRSIVTNGQLMRKTRVPYYIFPLSSMGSSIVNFLFQLAAFGIVLIFTGTVPSIHIAAFPLICLEMFMFSFGFGLILAVLNIYVRDTDYLYAVLMTAWLYLTPLFYPIEALPGWSAESDHSSESGLLFRGYVPGGIPVSSVAFRDHADRGAVVGSLSGGIPVRCIPGSRRT